MRPNFDRHSKVKLPQSWLEVFHAAWNAEPITHALYPFIIKTNALDMLFKTIQP